MEVAKIDVKRPRKILREELIRGFTVSTLTEGDEVFIRIRNVSNGRYFTDHRYYFVSTGGGLHRHLISKEVIDRLYISIRENGETNGFVISDGGEQVNRGVVASEVRHKLTNAELSFTSRGEKLIAHYPIFTKYRDTHFGSIIRATMTLHQLCSSKCQYCSTISRAKRDSISLDEAKDFVKTLYYQQAEFNKEKFPSYNESYKALTGSDIRLRSLILSGGGQPNLWPHFEEFVDWLSQFDVDLGLITNGFPKAISEDTYKKFKWIRISITPEDASPHYVNGRFDQQYLPPTIINNPDITVGYSYVFGPWTDGEILTRIARSVEENNFDYCRVLTDCNLSRSAQLLAHKALAETLFDQGHIDSDGIPVGKIFHQLKYHGTPDEAKELWDDGQCLLQVYNTFWDTTGHEENGRSFCYPCDSITVLTNEGDAGVMPSARRFEGNIWGTVTNDRVRELFESPVKQFFDPRDTCSACLFMKNNGLVKQLVAKEPTTDEISVSSKIQHVNFP